jgi:N-acetylglucosaminyldiphosphoundecaprenol N-acetyl-beta-D-mannosaminyltransferase
MSALPEDNVLCGSDGTPYPRAVERSTVSVGPMRITALSANELTHRLIGHSFGDRTHHLVTANAQFYVLAERNEAFRRCIAEAEYVCADGISIVMACKWLGKSTVSRVSGVDLVPLLCEQAATLGLPIYFLGGQPGSAAQSASLMMEQYPGLKVAGIGCPPVGFQDSPAVLKEVLRSVEIAKPAIIFVALGAPHQEFFIQQHIRPINIPVALGVGGSFEMISGRVRRAPRWMRRGGLEWAYRLVQEPRRLAKRYLVGNTLFSLYVMRYLLSPSRREEITKR